VGAAAIHFRHKENKREDHRRIAQYIANGNPKPAVRDWDHGFNRLDRASPPPSVAEYLSKPTNESTVLSTLASTQTQPDENTKDRRWRWRGPRRHRQARPVAQEASTDPPTVEINELQKAVERMWAEKEKSRAAEGGDKVCHPFGLRRFESREWADEVQAKEYARERVEKLSAALEALREVSLQPEIVYMS